MAANVRLTFIKKDRVSVTLEFKNRHPKDSHRDSLHTRITDNQKAALTTIIRINPVCRANAARRVTQNMDPESRIPNMINRQGIYLFPPYFPWFFSTKFWKKYLLERGK